jgi:endonuclease YncB( thermonuclease family)
MTHIAKELYTYKGVVDKVVDGDTATILLDIGFGIMMKVKYRFYGIDTAEKDTDLGKETKAFVTQKLQGKTVIIKSYKPDKYGRYLGQIYCDGDAKSINEILLESGRAKPYYGDSKEGLWTVTETSNGTSQQ